MSHASDDAIKSPTPTRLAHPAQYNGPARPEFGSSRTGLQARVTDALDQTWPTYGPRATSGQSLSGKVPSTTEQ